MTRRLLGAPPIWALASVVIALSAFMALTQWFVLYEAVSDFPGPSNWGAVVAHAAIGWVPWMVLAPLVAWLAIRFRFGTGRSWIALVAHLVSGVALATGAATAEFHLRDFVDIHLGHIIEWPDEPDMESIEGAGLDPVSIIDANLEAADDADTASPNGAAAPAGTLGIAGTADTADSADTADTATEGAATDPISSVGMDFDVPVCIVLPPGRSAADIDWSTFDPAAPEAMGITIIDPMAADGYGGVDGESEIRIDEYEFATPLFLGVIPPLAWLVPAAMAYAVFLSMLNGLLFARDARIRQVRADELKVELARSQLHVLRGQLQPHFLFNTLSSINVLMASDVPQARRMLNRLADLLRTSFRDVRSDESALADEIRFIRGYLEIEQTRFGDDLRVRFEVDPETEACRVPTMSLQPLVDNAIRHGVGRRAALGEIRVSARRRGDDLAVTVSDDGPGVDANTGEPVLGVGIGNVRDRVARLHGASGDVTISAPADGGFAVTIRVPFHPRSTPAVNESPPATATASPDSVDVPAGNDAPPPSASRD